MYIYIYIHIHACVGCPYVRVYGYACLDSDKTQDMGLAKFVVGKTFTTCGTPDYFAPVAWQQCRTRAKGVGFWNYVSGFRVEEGYETKQIQMLSHSTQMPVFMYSGTWTPWTCLSPQALQTL